MRVEELAHLHAHAVAQHQVVLHVGTAQVKHAVRETRGFRQVFLVDLEGGVTEGLSTFSSWHSTSILPLLELSLVVPAGARAPGP